MKATLSTTKTGMTITLENKVKFESQENESKEDFVTRVEEVVDRDYVESLELTEKKAPAKKAPAKKAPAKKQTDKKEPKEKEPKEKPSLESVLNAAARAKKSVGVVCTFTPFRTAIKTKGEVKQVVIDRRVNKAYYRINALEDGKLFHISVDNESFKIDEAATEKLAQKREKEAEAKAKEKADAAKKKKEAAAKKKADAAAKKKTATTKKPAEKGATKGKAWSRSDKAQDKK